MFLWRSKDFECQLKRKKISSTAWIYIIPCQGEECKAHFQGFHCSLESPLPLGPLYAFAQLCLLRTFPVYLGSTCLLPTPCPQSLHQSCRSASTLWEGHPCRVHKKSFMFNKGTWFASPLWMQKNWLHIWYFIRFFLRCSRMFPVSYNSFKIVNWIT